MPQLSPIINKVDKQTVENKQCEKRIIFDNKTDKIIYKEPSMFSFSDVDYYIISNSSSGLFAKHITSSFEVRVFNKEKYINIKIISELGCIAGKEELFLTSVLSRKANNFDTALSNCIKDWIYEFIGENTKGFIDGFYQNQNEKQLLDHIKNKAREIGITFKHIICNLEGREYLTTINARTDKIETRFKDSVVDYLFSFDATLLVDEENKINAISTHKLLSDFERLLKVELKEYFPKHISFERFISNRQSVKSEFIKHLNLLLKLYGRKVETIEIATNIDYDAPEQIKKDFPLTFKTSKYKDDIKLSNQILIQRANIAKFNSNKPKENLENWLEQQVQQSIDNVFFDKEYSEIYENFKELKTQIENELREKVSYIGYELRQIIVIPSFETINDLAMRIRIDETFVTSNKEKIKLMVEIDLEITQFEKIRKYIDSGKIDTLKENVTSLCVSEIKRFINSVDAQSFYENFLTTDEVQQLSAKHRLEMMIRNKLIDSFNPKISRVLIDVGEDKIIDQIQTLGTNWNEFNVSVASRVADRKETRISGLFRITNHDVNYWLTFQYQNIKIDDITNNIIKSLTSKLQQEDSRYLAYTSIKHRDMFDDAISKIIKNSIKKAFGLEIDIQNIVVETDEGINKAIKAFNANIDQTYTKIASKAGVGLDCSKEFEILNNLDIALAKILVIDVESVKKLSNGEFLLLDDKPVDDN